MGVTWEPNQSNLDHQISKYGFYLSHLRRKFPQKTLKFWHFNIHVLLSLFTLGLLSHGLHHKRTLNNNEAPAKTSVLYSINR